MSMPGMSLYALNKPSTAGGGKGYLDPRFCAPPAYTA